jgi:hypothetical protein
MTITLDLASPLAPNPLDDIFGCDSDRLRHKEGKLAKVFSSYVEHLKFVEDAAYRKKGVELGISGADAAFAKA